MAYVDLNPIRARIATTPETSSYTSVQERIQEARSSSTPNSIDSQPKTLLPFTGNESCKYVKGIQFHFTDYLELVDWTGRQIKANKYGSIDQNLPHILTRLGIEGDRWIYLSLHFESGFRVFAGVFESLKKLKSLFQYAREEGAGASKAVFG